MISSKLAHLALCVAAAAYVLLVPVRAQAEEVGPASPSNGIVVGTDHRVPICPDTWPWTSPLRRTRDRLVPAGERPFRMDATTLLKSADCPLQPDLRPLF